MNDRPAAYRSSRPAWSWAIAASINSKGFAVGSAAIADIIAIAAPTIAPAVTRIWSRRLQYRSESPNARESRSAVSVVIRRLPRMISLSLVWGRPVA